MIDGHKLIMSLNDWWYSSFGYEETDESKAIKKVIDEVEKYVEQADRKTEPTISKMEQVDEPQKCDDCIWNVCNYNKAFEDEPQTERSEQ